MREQNQRLTTGLSAVYQRDEKRSSFLAADQWTDAYFVFVNPFYARHVQEYICRTQNPVIPRAGGGGAERNADGSVRPKYNRPSDPLANQIQRSWTSICGSTNKANRS